MANNGLRRLLSAASAAGAAAAGLRSMCTCTLEAAAVVLPHPRKARTGGEDAYFIGDSVYGVFDGVGGVREVGLIPGSMSNALAIETAKEVESRLAWNAQKYDRDNQLFLKSAASQLQLQVPRVPGGGPRRKSTPKSSEHFCSWLVSAIRRIKVHMI